MRFETILVPLDFSVSADYALDAALDLAGPLGVQRIHLLHVHHPPPMPTPLPGSGPSYVEVEGRLLEEAALALATRAERVKAASLAVEVAVESGAPAEVVCAEAEKRSVDLIVMGAHGRTGLAHVLLGSVAERTVARAPCPVLTLRARETS
jgi:nucleotide-binding universal stress UspA family protein